MLHAPEALRKLIHGCAADRTTVFLFISTLALGACGGGSGGSLPLNAFNTLPASSSQPATVSPQGQAATTAVTARQISTQNAGSLIGSSLDITTILAGIGNIVTAVVSDGAELITAANTASGSTAPMAQCPGQSGRLSFQIFQPGNFLPPGKNLDVSFSSCAIEQMLVTGAMDISAIRVTGIPGNKLGTDWRLSALLSLNGLSIHNRNGGDRVLTNQLNYSAVMSNGVLRITLDIASAKNNTGGLNVEQIVSSTERRNYLVAPFFLITEENAPATLYSFTVMDNPSQGVSKINRYTTRKQTDTQGGVVWRSVGDDIEVLVSTTTRPLLWQQIKPDVYTRPPVDGEIVLNDVTASTSVTASIGNTTSVGGVTLSIDDGTAVTSQLSDWQTLLSLL